MKRSTLDDIIWRNSEEFICRQRIGKVKQQIAQAERRKARERAKRTERAEQQAAIDHDLYSKVAAFCHVRPRPDKRYVLLLNEEDVMESEWACMPKGAALQRPEQLEMPAIRPGFPFLSGSVASFETWREWQAVHYEGKRIRVFRKDTKHDRYR
jgi:hypothetical protein